MTLATAVHLLLTLFIRITHLVLLNILLIVLLLVHLWHYTELSLLHDLEVGLLRLLDLCVDTLDLKLVGVHLRLEVLELAYHLLQLLAALL